MLIVCPNLGIDHTVHVSQLVPGAVQRTGPATSAAGGKGANIARAATTLGGSPHVVGFVADGGGQYLSGLFADESLSLAPIEISGHVRTCTVLLEESGRVTLLNEPGPTVTPADWTALTDRVDTLLGDVEGWLVATGSLPPGSPPDSYVRLVELARSRGRQIVVDAGGPALRAGAVAGADLVCPNLSEALTVLDAAAGSALIEEVDERSGDTPERAMAAAAGLVALGAGAAAVTAGATGVALSGPGIAEWIDAVTVTARNPIGAGDSFLAGTLVARERGDDWPTAVRFGMATAASSVEHEGSGVIDPARVRDLATQLGRAAS